MHDGVHHATEPDEEQVLRELYGEPDRAGFFLAQRRITAVAAGATRMIGEARRSLGLSGRPNTITDEYASRHGDEFLGASWCDMAVTYWARHSGNTAAVLPGGDRAYTIWHAQDFQRAGAWHGGTTASVDRAKAGDIVFYDWGATDRVSGIDHVGVVEAVLGGGRLQTIEGNTDDAVKRRVRGSGVIAGYGRPDYGNQEDDMPDYVSVGVGEAQDLPPGEWVTVRWDDEFSDSAHHHRTEGGPSVVEGPSRYSINVNVRVEGLQPGTQLQARAIERADEGGDVENGPIAEYRASDGATFLNYALPAASVSSGSRVRFQIVHFGDAAGQLVSGTAKALAWRL